MNFPVILVSAPTREGLRTEVFDIRRQANPHSSIGFDFISSDLLSGSFDEFAQGHAAFRLPFNEFAQGRHCLLMIRHGFIVFALRIRRPDLRPPRHDADAVIHHGEDADRAPRRYQQIQGFIGGHRLFPFRPAASSFPL